MSILSPKLIQLVAIMSDCEFHDGDSLGQKLKVTRSAVWKMIKKLSDYGISITSIKGKGYKLDTPLLLLDPDSIQSALPSALNNKIKLDVFETIDSTNTFLKQHFDSNKISICISECQVGGNGRFHRNWFSPFGINLYMSFRFRIQKDISELGGLTLAVSVATMNTLKKFGVESKIKWPNDVYCNDQKISGNLIEIFAESNSTADAIIGIGLNINMDEIQTDDKLHWTSILKETGKIADRNKIAATLISELCKQLDLFSKTGISHFLNVVHESDYLQNKQITVTQSSNAFKGTASGIDEFGRLILTLNDGTTRHFSSGDAQIKR